MTRHLGKFDVLFDEDMRLKYKCIFNDVVYFILDLGSFRISN